MMRTLSEITSGSEENSPAKKRGNRHATRHSTVVAIKVYKRIAFIRRRAPVKDIHQLRDEIYAVTGAPRPVEFTDKVVGLIEYLDGTIIDTVKTVRA